MGTLKTTNIQTITGSGTLTLGTSGETLALGSGVTTSGNFNNLVLLNSQTVSSAVATVAFDSTYITDDYEYYRLMFYRVMPSVSSTSHLQLEYSTDNGSSFISGAIYTHRRYMDLESTTSGSVGGFGTGDTRFATITNTASRGVQGEINFFNFRQTWNKYLNAHVIGQESSAAYQWRVGSWIINTSKINYMRFFWGSSGANFTDGRFDLYGVKS